MKRRGLVLAGAAAAAAGLGWQLTRRPPGDPVAMASRPAGVAASAGAGEDGAAALWASSFTRPDGQVLAMASLRGAPLVVNFWGTWCPPCIKEMPELDRFAASVAAQGVRVLGLAIDNPKAVRDFLARQPVSYPIALAGFDGTDLSRKLGNSSGALPFTAVFDRQGRLVQRKLGTTDSTELARWVSGL